MQVLRREEERQSEKKQANNRKAMYKHKTKRTEMSHNNTDVD